MQNPLKPQPDDSRRNRRDRNLSHELGARASEPWCVIQGALSVVPFAPNIVLGPLLQEARPEVGIVHGYTNRG